MEQREIKNPPLPRIAKSTIVLLTNSTGFRLEGLISVLSIVRVTISSGRRQDENAIKSLASQLLARCGGGGGGEK